MESLNDRIRSAIEALSSGDDAEKCKAAWSLGLIGPAASEAVPALLRALEDQGRSCREWWDGTREWGTRMESYEYVRANAVRALFRIQPEAMGQARATMIEVTDSVLEWPADYDDPSKTTRLTFYDEEWEAAGGKPEPDNRLSLPRWV